MILSDLAFNIGEDKDELDNPDVLSTIELVTSKVETRALPADGADVDTLEERVFMVCSETFLTTTLLTHFSLIQVYNAILVLQSWL